MSNKESSELTTEELKKKESGLKALLWICSIAGVFLLGTIIWDSVQGKELESSLLIIAICSIGGGVSLYPQLKEVRTEIHNRTDQG